MQERFWVGHSCTGCGKSCGIMRDRGRATLQRRVSALESTRALAPVLRKWEWDDFFRSLFSRAAHGTNNAGFSPEGSFGISDGPANAFNATVHPVAKPERQDVT